MPLSYGSKTPDASAGITVPSAGKNGHQSPPHTSGTLLDSGEGNASTQLAPSSVLSPGREAVGGSGAKQPEACADSVLASREQMSQQVFEVKHLAQNGSGDCASVSQARGPPVEPVHVNGLNGRPEAGDVGTAKHAQRDERDRDWSRNVRPSTYPSKDREKDRERDAYRRYHDHNGGGDRGRDRYGDGYGHRSDRESRPPRPRSSSRERYRRDSDRYWDRHRHYHHRGRDHDRDYYHHYRHRSRGDRDRERDRRPAVGEYHHHHHRGSGHREDGPGRWAGEEGRTRPHHGEEEEQLSNRAKPSASNSNSNSHNSSASSGPADRKRSLDEDQSEERQVKKHKKSKKKKKSKDKHRCVSQLIKQMPYCFPKGF